MNSFSKTSHLMGLLDRFKLFLEFGDLNIPIYFILNVIERVKNKNIIYCDSNTLIRLVVKRVEQKYGIFFSPKTRFLAVKEVYVDRIYTQYKDFTPKLGEVVVDAGSETGFEIVRLEGFNGYGGEGIKGATARAVLDILPKTYAFHIVCIAKKGAR